MEFQDFTASPNYEDSGPMTVSDLHHSVPNKKKKKDFKRQKAHREKETTEMFTETDLNQQESNTQTTIEEPILNRLRSRLDPTYNTTTAPSYTAGAVMVDSDSLPESSTPPVDKSTRRIKKKRKAKSRDVDTNDQTTGGGFTTSETQQANNTAQDPPRVVGS